MKLKCGEHVLGDVTFDDADNFHCYATLRSGPDFAHYQPLFDEYLRLDGLAGAGDDDSDAAWAARDEARESRDALQNRIDALGLALEDSASHELSPIHDFHPEDGAGHVYWRWGHAPEERPTAVPHNPPMQRTGAAGIFSGVRKWFGRGPGR